jgi:hypothetical protein
MNFPEKMESKPNNRDRRLEVERRRFFYTAYFPERRSCKNRRSLDKLREFPVTNRNLQPACYFS